MVARHVRASGMTSARAISGEEAVLLLAAERFDVVVAGSDLPAAERLWERLEQDDMKFMPVIQVAFLGEKARPAEGRLSAFLTRPVREKQLGGALLRIFEALKREKERNEKPAAETGAKAKRPVQPAGHLNYRILLAEDNPVNQKVALAMLRHLGYRADVAENGQKVLDLLEREKKSYDVILMDIQMPEMDGLQATRAIRKIWGREPGIRIIAMTASALTGDREMCLEAGMDGYISKPTKIEALQEALQACSPGSKRKIMPGLQ